MFGDTVFWEEEWEKYVWVTNSVKLKKKIKSPSQIKHVKLLLEKKLY